MHKRIFFFNEENIIKGYNQGSSNIILEKIKIKEILLKIILCVYN